MLQPSVKFKKIGTRRGPTPLWKAYVQACAIAFFLALVLRAFVIQAYRIPSTSMEDTLLAGDFVMVNKLAYNGGKTPQIGDVIVFKFPLNPERDFVKRVIALPGQEVALRDKQLYVDSKPVSLPANGKNIDPNVMGSAFSNRDNFGPMAVPQATYFVMGDNRDDSEDSRFWGCVPDDHVKGKVMFVYWSWAPDKTAPDWEFPYIHSLFQIGWHNVTHLADRLRVDRLGHEIT